MKDTLVELVEKMPKRIARELLYSKYDNLRKWIYDNTPEPIRDQKYTLPTRIYWIVNGISDFPVCAKCGRKFGQDKNLRVTLGYGKYCKSCASHSEEARKKTEETCIKRYGVKNPSLSDEIKNKIRDVNIRKFGVPCPLQVESIRNKADETILEKYGTKYYQSTDGFKEKIKQTCMERYGVDSIFKDKEIRDKMKNSMLEKYGVEHNTQSKEIIAASKQRMVEKYGENYKQVIWGGHGNIPQNRRAYEYMKKSDFVEPLFSLEDYINGKKENPRYEFQFRCKTCGNIFKSWWDNGKTKVCPNCFRQYGTSKEENDLLQLIKSVYDGELETNTRNVISPYEIDVYAKDRKLAFEFDGLFWHNDEIHTDQRYHLEKTEMCEKHGIQLIHIFEDEWRTKRNIVESRIKNLFGVYDSTIYARKCKVLDVSNEDANIFLDENHIQGAVRSKIRIGLYLNRELVSLMTFGKSRFNRKYEWELLRFCNKIGYHIPGAASRLLKDFEHRFSPKSLVSYADRRWSVGKLYKALGFNLVGKSDPNYWYFKSSEGVLMSRMRFQKHKLGKILENFDESKSEYENMKANGYLRIFDCGNLVFSKECDNSHRV